MYKIAPGLIQVPQAISREPRPKIQARPQKETELAKFRPAQRSKTLRIKNNRVGDNKYKIILTKCLIILMTLILELTPNTSQKKPQHSNNYKYRRYSSLAFLYTQSAPPDSRDPTK